MCKLLSFTNTQKLTLDQIDQLTRITAFNMESERSGFGLTLNTNAGLFAKRFLNPESARLFGSPIPFARSRGQNEEGRLGTEVYSVIFHGRTSTNTVSLQNTHPIVKHGLWLSHNGVVEDSGPKYTMKTSNDTEHMVERMNEGIESIEKHITGYYATMHYREGSRSMFVLKDNIASLYVAEVPSLESYVIGTTEALIESVCAEMGLEIGEIEPVEDNIFFEVDGMKVLSMREITPKGRSLYADSKSHLSLGRSLYDSDYASTTDLWSSSYQSSSQWTAEDFFYEIETVDAAWTIDYRGRTITSSTFHRLSETEALECLLIRPDGTICSPDPSVNGTFFEGWVERKGT